MLRRRVNEVKIFTTTTVDTSVTTAATISVHHFRDRCLSCFSFEKSLVLPKEDTRQDYCHPQLFREGEFCEYRAKGRDFDADVVHDRAQVCRNFAVTRET